LDDERLLTWIDYFDWASAPLPHAAGPNGALIHACAHLLDYDEEPEVTSLEPWAMVPIEHFVLICLDHGQRFFASNEINKLKLKIIICVNQLI
jgi:hypothetical protein